MYLYEYKIILFSPTLEWHGDTIVSNDISNLLIVESSKLTQIAQTCLAENNEPVCSLREANVSIYKTVEDNYIVLCKDAKNIIPGEVIYDSNIVFTYIK